MFGQSISKRALLARAISYGGIGIASPHDIETTVVFLKEAVSLPQMIGAAFVLGGVMLVSGK